MSVAPEFEFQPMLCGATLRVRPIRADEFEALYAVAADPLVWAQHPAKQRSERPVFEQWFHDALAQRALVVELRESGRVVGSSRYYDWQPEAREVSIGFTFIARDQWGGATNRELKALMLAHAFERAHRVWFHVNPGNERSRRAMLKIGGIESHVGMHVIAGGPAVEYVFYRIDAADWRAAQGAR